LKKTAEHWLRAGVPAYGKFDATPAPSVAGERCAEVKKGSKLAEFLLLRFCSVSAQTVRKFRQWKIFPARAAAALLFWKCCF
jgi:hypothetical protein